MLRWLPLICMALLGIVVARMPKFRPAAEPDPPTKPVLALELPGRGEVARLLATDDARDSAAANTNWDWWFIAGYTLLFLAFAVNHSWPLRAVTIAVALATAAFDVWENLVIKRFIADPANAVDAAVWLPAKLKWLCFFAAVALVALAFARLGRWWWIAAILIAAPATIGAIASLLGRRVLIDRVTGAAILAIVAAALLLPFARAEGTP